MTSSKVIKIKGGEKALCYGTSIGYQCSGAWHFAVSVGAVWNRAEMGFFSCLEPQYLAEVSLILFTGTKAMLSSRLTQRTQRNETSTWFRALGHGVLCSHSSTSSRIQSVTTRDPCSEQCWPPSSDASVTPWAMCTSGNGVHAEWLWEIGAPIPDKQ